MRRPWTFVLVSLSVGCSGGDFAVAEAPDSGSSSDSATLDVASDVASGRARMFAADAWADNWFAAYLGDHLLKEDSVSITTERSFNAESFTFEATYPFVLSFVLKDYKENDSGLEYIGKTTQQIGDGGFIFQLREQASGKLVLVSGAAWRCFVVHKAPLNPTCEKAPAPLTTCKFESRPEPDGWKLPAFDDRSWPSAVEWTASDVGPKDGFTTIAWDPAARFVWSGDLKLDNTVLCRATVNAP